MSTELWPSRNYSRSWVLYVQATLFQKMQKSVFSVVMQSFQEAPLENLDWRNTACLWIWNHKHLLYIMFPVPKLHFFCKPFNHLSTKKQSRSLISQTWSVYGYQPEVKQSKTCYLSSIKHCSATLCLNNCLLFIHFYQLYCINIHSDLFSSVHSSATVWAFTAKWE